MDDTSPTPLSPAAARPPADSRAGLPGAPGRAQEGALAPAPPPDAAPSVVERLLRVLKREPVLFVSLAYVLVSFMGLWSSYWFYRALGLPILDYLQGSDLFIAGLRKPDYALMVGLALLIMWLGAFPMRWVERHPRQAEALRRDRWWGRYIAPEPRSWMALWGMRSDTLMAATFLFFAMLYLYAWNTGQARRLVAGAPGGQPVQLTLAGSAAPLPGEALLLGTTSAFALVWWPHAGQVEALPTANIARFQSLQPPRVAQRAEPLPAASGTEGAGIAPAMGVPAAAGAPSHAVGEAATPVQAVPVQAAPTPAAPR
jgi:hypothetical protein